MYFQFLTEDKSTEVLVEQIMNKLKDAYPEKELFYDIKSFHGIGHLKMRGNVQQQKTGKLLNDLFPIMRGIGKALLQVEHAAIIVILDNDKNDRTAFQNELNHMAVSNMIFADHEFCIAVKEMEAWLLGDVKASDIVGCHGYGLFHLVADPVGRGGDLVGSQGYVGELHAVIAQSHVAQGFVSA